MNSIAVLCLLYLVAEFLQAAVRDNACHIVYLSLGLVNMLLALEDIVQDSHARDHKIVPTLNLAFFPPSIHTHRQQKLIRKQFTPTSNNKVIIEMYHSRSYSKLHEFANCIALEISI